MKLSTLTMGKRTIETTLVEVKDPIFNIGVYNPAIPGCLGLSLAIGYDKKGRYVSLDLTPEEARKLGNKLVEAAEKCENLFKVTT